MAEQFSRTLSVRDFNVSKVKQERKEIKRIVKHYLPSTLGIHELGQQLFQTRCAQFPNLSLLVEFVMVVGVSNSSFEYCFSYLTVMLLDQRLSLSHSTMAGLILICTNHCAWSDLEQQEIVDGALKTFMAKCRKTLASEEISGLGKPPLKKC